NGGSQSDGEQGKRKKGREMRLPRLSKPIHFGLCSLTLILVVTFLYGYSSWNKTRRSRLTQELIAAIKDNDNPKGIALLNQGADANAWDKEYETYVLLLPYELVRRGMSDPMKDDSDLTRAVLEHGADPYTVDSVGNTILHFACHYDHPKT